MPRDRRAEIVGIALLALLALASLARRDLFVGDETKYAQVVREMHAHEEAVLLPTLNGSPYTHKPPLHFWLIYAFTGIGGQRALWPYVLPAILSALVLVWLTGWIAKDWLGAASEWSARFYLCGLAMVWGLAQLARMDLLFACFTTGGALSLYRYLDSDRKGMAVQAGVWFGLGALVKGPAAALILASLYVAESIGLRRRPRIQDVVMLGVAVVVPLLWFVPAVIHAGPEYLDEIVMKQTAGRAVGSWVHSEPPWYYLVLSPAIVFPWFFLLIGAMRSVRGAKGEEGPSSPAPLPARGERGEKSALLRLIRWVLSILVPFSLIGSKLPVYMVPAFPAVAMLAAWYAELPPDRARWRAMTMGAHRVGLALLALVPLVALSGLVPLDADAEGLSKATSVRVALAVMAAASLAGLVAGWRSLRASSVALPFTIALPVAILLTAGAGEVNRFASSQPLVDALSREVRPGDVVGMHYTPHLWSRELPVELEAARQFELEELKAGAGPSLLAVRTDQLETLGAVMDAYQQVSSVRFMGKTFHVYRKR